MASSTVRVSEATRATLRELASQTGLSMQEVLDRAVDEYRRRSFFEALNRAFTALRNDPQAWAEELEERKAWEGTLADGLERE
jgi:predicted transcriptional regulator